MKKRYEPIQEIYEYLAKKYAGLKVLEIGPGHIALPIATHFVDHIQKDLPNYYKLDICNEKLPFENDFFDFVYCRHVLEDINNPVFVFNEIKRVGKAGYIETPSSLVETTRKIDVNDPEWRGYNHHRYILWNEKDELRCIAKYPIIEHLQDLKNVDEYLKYPIYWNNYYYWDDKTKVSMRELKHDIHFDIREHYEKILNITIDLTIKNCNEFYKLVKGG